MRVLPLLEGELGLEVLLEHRRLLDDGEQLGVDGLLVLLALHRERRSLRKQKACTRVIAKGG